MSTRYQTIESDRYAEGCTTPHATYLDALLYLIKRSTGLRRGNTDVYAVESTGTRILVKTYKDQAYPSTSDIRSAVLKPERTRTWKVGGQK